MMTERSLLLSAVRAAVAASPTDFAPGLEKAFPSEFEEWEGRLKCVEGAVPEYLRGTYYLNGPARFRVGDVQYRHWLDGDGMVSRLRFDATGIHFKSRYIRSTKSVREREAGRALFRGFGTAFPDSRLNRLNHGLESPVNISVYPFGGCLLAFGEQGLPWELHPETLETLGQFTFAGRLNDASPMAAHPKFDARTGEMFNFGILFSAQNPKLYFYCFSQEGLQYRKFLSLPYPCSVHDFALSEHYAVFYLSPYLLDIEKFLGNSATVMEALSWEPALDSRLVVLDRRDGELAASLDIGHRYCLHLINSFEQHQQLMVDVLEFDAPIYSQYQPLPDFFCDVPRGGPVRFAIDLRSQKLVQRIGLNYLQAPDFPAIDPHCIMRSYDEFWMLGVSATGSYGRKFFDQLVHARWNQSEALDVYQSPTYRYLAGEPVFVGQPGSAEGVVMCQEFDAEHELSYFLLFDAHRVSVGPVARIAVGSKLYLGFHAVFQPRN